MLGVCYYPEHWSEDLWAQDAQEMRALGLDYVRIGEFCWSRIEPERNVFQFDWLDRAINILVDAGLRVVFGTPTATPPKWLIDEFPEILPVDPETGRVRGFGSRRHYDFSSEVYLREASRITEVLVRRYGHHPGIVGWQTDNELSCHDTTLSGSEAAKLGFRKWCQKRYGSIEALNKAWGTVFWSMEYTSFDQIDLPIGTVTEPQPAHNLAYRRYSSDQVVAFHDAMVAIIRTHAPGKWVTHNFIPKEDISADTYALGAPLDFASYDNYPLGRTDMAYADQPDVMRKYMRTGHPDFSSFYHDTTRSFSGGNFWVMEQQPGPVNWAPHNPRPLPGMVRLWSLEAFAHGAACVSYFRWRQVPFAQEQMHAGIKLPDNTRSKIWQEIKTVRREIDALKLVSETKGKAPVAIITDVQALWVDEIERQGKAYNFRTLEMAYYSGLRQLGVDVDFVSQAADFEDYKLVIAPFLPIVSEDFVARCERSSASFVFGPRAGSKNDDFCVPENLAPGHLQRLLPARVTSVETLRADCPRRFTWNGKAYSAGAWCEEIEWTANVAEIAHYDDGDGGAVAVAVGRFTYIGAVVDDAFLKDFFIHLCSTIDVPVYDTPDDVRICHRGTLGFAFNYGATAEKLPLPDDTHFEIGGLVLGPQDVAVWRRPQATG